MSNNSLSDSNDLLALFCDVDDFCNDFEPRLEGRLLKNNVRSRRRPTRLTLSEMMTIFIHFHQANHRTFKHFYKDYVLPHLRPEFPGLCSYNRFVELLPRTLVPLTVYLHLHLGECSGISFVDSTALAVCENGRIASHRVFEGVARRGRTSTGWFFGFKLHLVVNDQGELLAVCVTAGNVDDRQALPTLCRRLFGKLFGDRGYIGWKYFEELLKQGVQLITRLKRNMKNKLVPLWDKLLLRRRAIIESVIDQLKNISQIEHTRHRSHGNFAANLMAGLIAYQLRPKKPSLNLREDELASLVPSVS